MRRERILAVDDDPLNLAILEELLAADYDVLPAQSGEDALASAVEWKPDLVLLDLTMPGIDGYETCRRMRADASLRFVKILLLSGRVLVSERLAGYEAGADDYIAKPFDHGELIAKLRVFLRLKFMEEMDDLKSDFMTLAAHDLRTPLSQILVASEILNSKTPMSEDDRRMMGNAILTAARWLQDTCEKTTLLITLRSGQPTFETELVNIPGVFREACADREGKAVERRVWVDLSAPESIVIPSERANVRCLAGALIDFALHVADPEARLQLSIREETGWVHISLQVPTKQAATQKMPFMFDAYASGDVIHHSGKCRLELPLAAELLRHLGGQIVGRAQDGISYEVDAKLPAPRAESDLVGPRDQASAGLEPAR